MLPCDGQQSSCRLRAKHCIKKMAEYEREVVPSPCILTLAKKLSFLDGAFEVGRRRLNLVEGTTTGGIGNVDEQIGPPGKQRRDGVNYMCLQN